MQPQLLSLNFQSRLILLVGLSKTPIFIEGIALICGNPETKVADHV